ncbi:IS3 family transposase [Streptomyces noursei]|uniref:IS3 family transposase n=1 Tax=Streptomyces noursei TaxID=1971 RepID=UPI000C9BCA36
MIKLRFPALTYGSPRITAELRQAHGMRINEKGGVRMMRKFRIAGVRLRKHIRTTIPEPSQTPMADLFRRDFTAPGPKSVTPGGPST